MIYLDNAATSYPKPQNVLNAVKNAVEGQYGNPGRSGHAFSKRSAEAVFSAREQIALLLGLKKSENVVFTGGATAALNVAILGTVSALSKRTPVPRVVSSVFEHNSVLRPLFFLEKKGLIRLTLLSPDRDGGLPLARLLSSPPQLLVLTLRSNLTGRSFDTKFLSRLLAPYGTVILADGAQAVGGAGASFRESGAHILCAPGHKGLLGIMGGGLIAFSEDCPLLPDAVFTGGSGSDTFNPEMPSFLPERLEAGTLPVPAIISMGEGARFLQSQKLESITARERALKKRLLSGLAAMKKYTLYEPWFEDGPLLINHKRLPSEKAAESLAEKGLMLRGGFHCAPLAHRWLGTEEHGALRLSPGPFTTAHQIDRALNLLESL
ncbi:MAG: aminotransferase class V-fold PLP-dependent enzyme [Ruminococcaceae bacterium]|nr:aminotransferase class V-fold PLP-dependent enzyme [Oscillospiraceae bacterium]